MEGRWWVLILFFALPAALIGVTIAYFSSNPVSILALIAVMTTGFLYFVTYTDRPGFDAASEPHW